MIGKLLNKKMENKENLIHLKNIALAEYKIVYYCNEVYSINELSSFRSKHQLLFQKIQNRTQLLNLVLVDGLFPNILADLALEVFINKVSTLNEYIIKGKSIIIIDYNIDTSYFLYKFKYFINLLLFSNIASKNPFRDSIVTNRIYYIKNKKKRIEFYSISQQKELEDVMLKKIKVNIDINKSKLTEKNLSLYLKIYID
jgi:hypothetical protein